MGAAISAASTSPSFDWNAYGLAVLAGDVPVCRYTRLAVERHYRDIQTAHLRGLHFSDALAQHALESFLFLQLSKGKWKGQQFKLEPWQQFWIALAFGWLRKDGSRRFRKVWQEVSRKNGKTAMVAGIAVYMLEFDGEGGAEVYAAATKKDQAKELFDEATRMVTRSKFLNKHYVLKRGGLYGRKDSSNKFLPLGRDSLTLDGANPHCAVLDELHAHRNSGLYDVLISGMGARHQPLLWQITTAGFDLTSFGYQQHQYAVKVLEGLEDDETLVVIYGVDHPEKWTDPTEWKKANPNLGISIYYDNFKAAIESAVKNPGYQRNIKTKHLNMWLAGGESWIAIAEWRACADHNLQLEDFNGEECWGGLDLAEKSDIAALALIFRRNGKFYLFVRLYHNRFEVDKPENDHLRRFAERGELIVNEGNATDFDVIKADIERFHKQFDIKEIAFDPKFAAYFVQKLLESGVAMVELSQTSSNFTLPVTEIENQVLLRELVHEGNSAMEWMVGNVVLRESKFSGLKHPTKEERAKKIDGPIAAINAMSRAMMYTPEPDFNDFIMSPITG